jgi:hypothetical protein
MDLVADRGRRHMQLVGGPAEAHVPGRGFERPQRAQGGKMIIH